MIFATFGISIVDMITFKGRQKFCLVKANRLVGIFPADFILGVSLTRSFIESHMSIFHPHWHKSFILSLGYSNTVFIRNFSCYEILESVITIKVRGIGTDESISSALMIGFLFAFSRFIDFTAFCIS